MLCSMNPKLMLILNLLFWLRNISISWSLSWFMFKSWILKLYISWTHWPVWWWVLIENQWSAYTSWTASVSSSSPCGNISGLGCKGSTSWGSDLAHLDTEGPSTAAVSSFLEVESLASGGCGCRLLMTWDWCVLVWWFLSCCILVKSWWQSLQL